MVGHFRPDQLAAMAHKSVGKADEYARLLRQFARHLGGVRAIIDAGAKNLAWPRDDRLEFYFGEFAIRRGALRDAAHPIHCAGGERRAKVGLCDLVVERDHAIVAQRSEPVLAVGGEAQKSHALLPFLAGPAFRNKPWRDTKYLCHTKHAP